MPRDDTASITSVSTNVNGAVAQLRTRNSQLPISRLTPTILLRIFHLVIFGGVIDPSGFVVVREPLENIFRHQHFTRPLRSITTVCFGWRAIAVRDPHLWTWVFPARRRWSRRCIRRSQNHPINIFTTDLTTKTATQKAFIEEVSAGSTPVRQLIACGDPTSLSSLPSLLSNHSSTFESLHMKRLARSKRSDHSVDASHIFSLPHLHCLTIAGFPICGELNQPFQATSLTTLRLKEVDSSFFDSLCVSLRLTPALRVFDVEETFEGSTSAPRTKLPSDGLPICLDQLVSLRFSSIIQRCISFISSLQYPQNATIMLSTTPDGTSEDVGHALAKELIAVCGFCDAPSTRQLEVSAFPLATESMFLSRWDKVTSPFNDLASRYKDRFSQPGTTVHFQQFPRLDRLLEDLVPLVSVPKLQHLTWDMQSEDVGGCKTLCSLVHKTPLLEEISFGAGRTIDQYSPLFCALSDRPESNALQYLPSLARLRISEVVLGSVDEFEDGSLDGSIENEPEDELDGIYDDKYQLNDQFRALRRILETRKQNKAPLDCLSLAMCYGVDEGTFQRLEKLGSVREVIWDWEELGLEGEQLEEYDMGHFRIEGHPVYDPEY